MAKRPRRYVRRPHPGTYVLVVSGPYSGAEGRVVYIPRYSVAVEWEERGHRTIAVVPISSLHWRERDDG